MRCPASVKGEGDSYYIGGGLLARMDFVDTGPGHAYAEVSGRAGAAHNEYGSGDLRDSLGREADYDSSSAYYGLHLGTGYIWNITEKASLDLYGKYFWTRHLDAHSPARSCLTGLCYSLQAATAQRL